MSVDALARTLGPVGLPHSLCVDFARRAIAAGDPSSASGLAALFARTLLGPVVNATGVLLHTNLGRAPLAVNQPAKPMNVEIDLRTGERGSRQDAIGQLLAQLCGTEAAMVVNNNAAAVMLVLAALASGQGVAVSRGESVEIGGGFRIPDVMEQSGATLVDVGTTNRTRAEDYLNAIERGDPTIALVLKVHPSNFHIEGFVERCSTRELAKLPVPVVADLGSGLIDSACPWLPGPPPPWLAGEPAVRQTVEEGAAIVTFSGDKLFGGPQAGIIAGRRQLVDQCLRHPLARALRPGGLVLAALQATTLAYLDRSVAERVPLWRMAATPVADLVARAEVIHSRTGRGRLEPMRSLPGAGSAPGSTIDSYGLVLDGDHVCTMRAHGTPVVARARAGCTYLDLRSVDPEDDHVVVNALSSLSD